MDRSEKSNEQFYWTKDFAEQSYSEKTNEINRKRTIILRANEMGRSLTMNEQNENLNVLISKSQSQKIKNRQN